MRPMTVLILFASPSYIAAAPCYCCEEKFTIDGYVGGFQCEQLRSKSSLLGV